jgi:hypothetical protein
MGGLFGGGQKAPPPPTIQEVKVPVVDQTQVDRQTADIMRRRRGANATIGTGSQGSTAGSVAAKTLLGS